MSQYFLERFSKLTPYVPGEQPNDQPYIKLNTNESPFPPCPEIIRAVEAAADRLQLYPDPEGRELIRALSKRLNLPERRILLTNGSDEALNFAFMAYCDALHPVVFPDITYGFYPVFAELHHIPFSQIPLTSDFRVDPEDYCAAAGTVVLANPNAPTGRALSVEQIERIVQSKPERMVIIDEAYVDFGAKSVVGLVDKYRNLLVVQTFSKSRSLAGARLGFAVGQEALIADLNAIKYATNPYNVNRMTLAAGVAAVENDNWFRNHCTIICENREFLTGKLMMLGFSVIPSEANFVLARHDLLPGEALYLALKRRGILVRHFDAERIRDYICISVGSRNQLEKLLQAIQVILEES